MKLRSDMKVDLVDSMGGDESVARAARVSHLNDGDATRGLEGLIGYLMKHKHGTPFEAVVLQYRIEAPIFVARELMRQRIASWNEASARYTELPGEFWVPGPTRDVVQTTSAARPEFTYDAHVLVEAENRLSTAYETAYREYKNMIDAGVAREVARAALPVGVYTRMYLTLNLRSLLNMLEVRTHLPGVSANRSYPQHEAEEVALLLEAHARGIAPIVLAAFDANGRVAP